MLNSACNPSAPTKIRDEPKNNLIFYWKVIDRLQSLREDRTVPRRFTSQPTPTVTDADVRRVVKRDFSPRSFDAVLALLEQCRAVEAARTRLAILKLADGDMDELVYFLSVACDDYREVIMAAEYPECLSYVVSGRPKDRTELDVWIADWEQYENWLNR